MVTPDDWRVEPVLVHLSLSRPPRQKLRILRAQHLIADCATVADVAQHVELGALVPEQR
jgi:hypothetical protein